MGPAGGRDLAAVVTLQAAGQTVAQGVLVRGPHPDLGQDPDRVGLRRRLDQPGDHQRGEHLIGQRVEPQRLVGPRQGVPQQATAGVLDHRLRGSPADRVQVEHVLLPVEPLLRRRHQHRQFGLVVRRSDVLQDPALPVALLDDLHVRRPRRGLHLPHERAHHTTLQTTS